MSGEHEDCVVCMYLKRDDRGLSLVPDPKLEQINDILVYAKEVIVMAKVNSKRCMNIWNLWNH